MNATAGISIQSTAGAVPVKNEKGINGILQLVY